MNATEYADMHRTGIAPCGCEVVFSDNEGNEMSSVWHTCDPDKQDVAMAADEQARVMQAERNERKMLLNSIPLDKLRALFSESGEELKERKPAAASRK